MSEEVSLSIKTVIVGDCTVGKTSFLLNYLKGSFPVTYEPTVHENHVGCYSDGENDFHITFWDTSGEDQYAKVRCLSYRETSVFVVCFSVAHRDTFKNVSSRWLPEIRKHCSKEVPIILLGTKTDMRAEAETHGRIHPEKRMTFVTEEEGIQLAQRELMCAYIECSARKSVGCHEAIKTAVEAAKNFENPTKTKACCTVL